jgi:hypothetical protein
MKYRSLLTIILAFSIVSPSDQSAHAWSLKDLACALGLGGRRGMDAIPEIKEPIFSSLSSAFEYAFHNTGFTHLSPAQAKNISDMYFKGHLRAEIEAADGVPSDQILTAALDSRVPDVWGPRVFQYLRAFGIFGVAVYIDKGEGPVPYWLGEMRNVGKRIVLVGEASHMSRSITEEERSRLIQFLIRPNIREIHFHQDGHVDVRSE